jgi:hypothetical protein
MKAEIWCNGKRGGHGLIRSEVKTDVPGMIRVVLVVIGLRVGFNVRETSNVQIKKDDGRTYQDCKLEWVTPKLSLTATYVFIGQLYNGLKRATKRLDHS